MGFCLPRPQQQTPKTLVCLRRLAALALRRGSVQGNCLETPPHELARNSGSGMWENVKLYLIQTMETYKNVESLWNHSETYSKTFIPLFF